MSAVTDLIMSVMDPHNRIVCLTLLGLFLQGFHCRSLNYTFHAVEVESCPGNLSEWMAASESLNCSTESSTINNFHCVPDYHLTRLLQFCYDSSRIFIGKGLCAVLSRSSTLDAINCSQFIEGKCPSSPYLSNRMYEVPACLEIDSECHSADPSCERATPQTADTTPFVETIAGDVTEGPWSTIVSITLGVLLPVLSIIVIAMVCRKKGNRGWNCVNRKPRQGDLPKSSKEEIDPLMSDSGVNNPTVRDETDALNHSGVSNPESEVHNVQSKTDKILQSHKKDKTYVRTTAVDAALSCLEAKHVIILTGKEGEGKTKAAHQVLHELSQKGFVALKVRSKGQWSRIVNANYQYAVLLDNVVSAANESKSFLDEVVSCAEGGRVNVIIVCREKELEELKTMHPVCELFGTPDYTINLSSSFALKTEEKRQILRQYEMARKRELADEDREKILNTDTFFGFPYTCSLFFAQDDFFNQGPSFFSHTNRELLDRIKRLRNMNASLTEKGLYCVLCYVFENSSLDKSQIDEQLLAEIAVIISVPKIRPCDVSDAVSDLKGVYLMETSETNVYDFIHETVREAVCISYGELDLRRVIEKCPRKTLNAVARIANYQEKSKEIVLKIAKENYDVFARRMLLNDLKEEKILDDLKEDFVLDIKAIEIVTNIVFNHFSSDSDFVKVLLTCAVPPSCDMPRILRLLWDFLILDRHTALLENMLEIYGPHIAAFSQQSGNRINFHINRDDIDDLIQHCLILRKEDTILVLMKYVRKHKSLHDIASFMYTRRGRHPMALMQFCMNHGWGDVLEELQAIYEQNED